MKKISLIFAAILTLLFSLTIFSACNEKYWFVDANDLTTYTLVAKDYQKEPDDKVKIKVVKGKDLEFSLTTDETEYVLTPSVYFNDEIIEGVKDADFKNGTKWDFNVKISGNGKITVFDATKPRYDITFTDEQALSPMNTQETFTHTLYDNFQISTSFAQVPMTITAFLGFINQTPTEPILHGFELIVKVSIGGSVYSLDGIEMHYKYEGDENFKLVTKVTQQANSKLFYIKIYQNTIISPVVCAANAITQ